MTNNIPQQFPVPVSVSEVARQVLAAPAPPPSEYPSLEDTAAWLQLVEQTDSYIAAMFAGMTLPVTTVEQEIAGVHTYVARAEGVPDTENGPIYLNLHGGALIFGGGEACKIMNDVIAMRTGMVTWGVDYRMPPLHPFPAALDDCLAVYRALLEVRDPAQIFVGGGSAGGTWQRR